MIYWKNYHIPRFGYYTYKNRKYNDVIIVLDTETTTLINFNGEWVTPDYDLTLEEQDKFTLCDKRAFVYIWILSLNDDVIYGREMSEFFDFWSEYKAHNPSTSIVYVHNLGYDFEFFGEYMPTDTSVFARAPYKPIYIRSAEMGVEFRCSYMLTNMSLDSCAKQWKLRTKKLVGNLIYNKARTPLTPLSEQELDYCSNDCLVVYEMIKQVFLTRYSCVAEIPLTQTGEVRRVIRGICERDKRYMNDMQKLKPTLSAYKVLTEVVQGGYAHLNFWYNDEVLTNVSSYDKASSYPDVMCTRKYPMGQFRLVTRYVPNDKNYCYILHLKLENIRSRGTWAYIPRHRLPKTLKCQNDNGKLNAAVSCEYWCTDVDYEIIKQCYVDKDTGGAIRCEILHVYRAYSGYLPLDIVKEILTMYSDKTTLKNVEGGEALYMRQKQMLNSAFG